MSRLEKILLKGMYAASDGKRLYFTPDTTKQAIKDLILEIGEQAEIDDQGQWVMDIDTFKKKVEEL